MYLSLECLNEYDYLCNYYKFNVNYLKLINLVIRIYIIALEGGSD